VTRSREEIEFELGQLRELTRQQSTRIAELKDEKRRALVQVEELYTVNRALVRALRELDPANYDYTFQEGR